MAARPERGFGWETFPHGSDIGVRGFGLTREAAYEQVALALTAVVTDPAVVREDRRVEIVCGGDDGDDEILLDDWLNAVIYEMATRRMVFGRFAVEPCEGGLRGTAWGEAVDVQRHRPAVEFKGATCTELAVRRSGDGTWCAQCVVDV